MQTKGLHHWGHRVKKLALRENPSPPPATEIGSPKEMVDNCGWNELLGLFCVVVVVGECPGTGHRAASGVALLASQRWGCRLVGKALGPEMKGLGLGPAPLSPAVRPRPSHSALLSSGSFICKKRGLTYKIMVFEPYGMEP